jgi:hypothetical protein
LYVPLLINVIKYDCSQYVNDIHRFGITGLLPTLLDGVIVGVVVGVVVGVGVGA